MWIHEIFCSLDRSLTNSFGRQTKNSIQKLTNSFVRISRPKQNLVWPCLSCPHSDEGRKSLILNLLFLVVVQERWCLHTHSWWNIWTLVFTHQKHEKTPSKSMFLVPKPVGVDSVSGEKVVPSTQTRLTVCGDGQQTDRDQVNVCTMMKNVSVPSITTNSETKVEGETTEVKMSRMCKRSELDNQKKTYQCTDKVTVLGLVCEKNTERVIMVR